MRRAFAAVERRIMPDITLTDALRRAFTDATYKCVISNPVQSEFRRVELRLIDGAYHVEKLTATQAFHENLHYGEAQRLVAELLSSFLSLTAWDAAFEHNIKISKKGRVLYARRKNTTAPEKNAAHNREKSYLIPDGEVIAPLVDMGIFTEDGKVRAAKRDKYRQINRFIEIIDDEVKKTDKKSLRVLDFGCGKSYLTFVLYYYFTKIRGLDVRMTGLDLKADVIEKCNAAAEKYGYGGLDFVVGDIADYDVDGGVDIVITLHACDTATDFALMSAIRWGAEMIFSVPCCQHELNAQMKSESLGILTRYGIVQERFAALLTDSIRANLLECAGYRTQMVEFVAFDHTPKNIMLRAVKKPGRDKTKSLAEVEAALREFNVSPMLYKLLKEADKI